MTTALSITSLNLACCAVESATGVSLWQERAEHPDAADGLNVLVVAGTVTNANAHLVRQAYEGLAEPRAVVAFGVCTISGGPYWDSYAVLDGIGQLVPVDVFVPGCPPTPQDMVDVLDGLARNRPVAAEANSD